MVGVSKLKNENLFRWFLERDVMYYLFTYIKGKQVEFEVFYSFVC